MARAKRNFLLRSHHTTEEAGDGSQFTQPVGPTEESLLENLVAAKWRLGRARKEETGFFAKRAIELEHESQEYRELARNGRLAMIVDLDSAGSNTLAKISRYEARLERPFYKALSELRRIQSQREPLEPAPAKQTNPRIPLPLHRRPADRRNRPRPHHPLRKEPKRRLTHPFRSYPKSSPALR